MSSPSALIVDDEPLLRAGLARQLAACWPQLRIVGEAGNVEEALQTFEQHQPSIVFLDIQMPGRSGLQLAEQLSGRCRIVFVTAHEHYALAAFERAAVDYLLKPVADDRLRLCVQRLQSQLQQSPPDKLQGLLALLNQNPSLEYLQWIKVSKRNEIRLLAISEIDYFQAEDKYLNVYSQNHSWLLRTSLLNLEAQLDPAQFLRIHRSIIVRIAAIHSIKRNLSGNGHLQLKNTSTTLPVSRTAMTKLTAG